MRLSRLWALPALVPVALLRYVAVAVGAYYAFTSWDGVSAQADFVGFANFQRIFSDEVALKSVGNTLLLATCAVILSNVIGMLLALGLNTMLKTRQFLRSLFFAPFALTPLAVSYVWAFIFDYDGLLNKLLEAVGLSAWKHVWTADPDTAIWTILVVLVWQLSGLCMIIYLSGLQGIPEEILESSELDGAGVFARFRHVMLPMLNAAITVAVALPTIMTLRVFDQVMGLTNGGPAQVTETLATQIYRQSFASGNYGYGAAIALVLTVLIAAVAVAQILILRRGDKESW
ncbi:raffinose/stachyose/melibiose transport system permease protein [Paenarthrobacter nicotinovorans]|uniref:carbohydrate ABC transporter permease n=1 Tax=Paenarthrobacter nicotinovorans TaxID=29320 RepID=UPI00278B8D8F|nr:sugar ABC transporter permease [Paenarthrobacter nicotinovorans]MDP9936759.1 raffinose/stachyose/melibiose transport system permease protein [Paenarthrobacter nicotinovorans]